MKQSLVAVKVLVRVFMRTKEELGLCLAVFAMTNLFFASIMTVAEHGRGNPNFDNFFDCLWWSCVTLTTVGYGDLVPSSVVGKMVAMCAMFCGILFFALPTSILGAAWVTELQAEGTI